MEFVDTHSHLSDEAFRGEEAHIIERASAAGVVRLLQADIDSSERPGMRSLCVQWPGMLKPMLGLYPGSVSGNWREEIDELQKWYGPEVVAMGEIGLDYHEGREFRKEQMEVFRIQLEMAAKWDLPVNIHLRDATEDFFSVLEDCSHLGLRGNLHAFSGSAQTAGRLLKYGDWYVGIGGVLTFRKASIAEEIKEIPLERIVLETDAPYLAPTPLRGTRNESANIPVIAEFLARAKNTSLEKVAEITTKNAKNLFAKAFL